MLTVADRGEGGKICQNLADVICERSLCHCTRFSKNYRYDITSCDDSSIRNPGFSG